MANHANATIRATCPKLGDWNDLHSSMLRRENQHLPHGYSTYLGDSKIYAHTHINSQKHAPKHTHTLNLHARSKHSKCNQDFDTRCNSTINFPVNLSLLENTISL